MAYNIYLHAFFRTLHKVCLDSAPVSRENFKTSYVLLGYVEHRKNHASTKSTPLPRGAE